MAKQKPDLTNKKVKRPMPIWHKFEPRPHPRARVKFTSGLGQVATWKMDLTGEITILIDHRYLTATEKKKAKWALDHIIAHEYIEAKLAVVLARRKYPHLSPYVAAEECQELGGEAHFLAIEQLDEISEDEYVRNCEIELEFLELDDIFSQ